MTEQEKSEQEKAFEEWWLKTYHPWNVVQCARDGFLAGYALGECVHGSAEARGDRAQAVMDALHAIEGADDVITEDDICNQLLDHWAEQNKPHLDDEDKCCYALAVRAADEIRRLRAEVDALRAAIGNLDITGGGVCAAREVVKQFDSAGSALVMGVELTPNGD